MGNYQDTIGDLHKVTRRFKKLDFSRAITSFTKSEFIFMKTVQVLQMKKNNETNELNEEEKLCPYGFNVSDLAAMLEVSPPMISKTIKSLIQKGYIICSSRTEDKRNRKIELSPEGIIVLEQADVEMMKLFELVMDKFGEEKTYEMIGLINEFGDAIDDVIKENRKPVNKDKNNSGKLK